MVKICTLRRKRRHPKETKNGQKFAKTKQKKEKKKKRAELFLFCSSAQQTHKERENAECGEKKMSSENINDKQMTTRERQHIEVAKLERELNALKVDAFAKVRCCFFFFFVTLLRNSFRRHHHHFRWVCVLNRDDEISYRSRSVRCLLGFQRQQQPAKSPNAFTSTRADE